MALHVWRSSLLVDRALSTGSSSADAIVAGTDRAAAAAAERGKRSAEGGLAPPPLPLPLPPLPPLPAVDALAAPSAASLLPAAASVVTV